MLEINWTIILYYFYFIFFQNEFFIDLKNQWISKFKYINTPDFILSVELFVLFMLDWLNNTFCFEKTEHSKSFMKLFFETFFIRGTTSSILWRFWLRFWKKREGLSSHKTKKLSSKWTFCAVFWFVFEDFRKDVEEYRSVWNRVEWKRISKTNPKLTIFSTNFVRNPHRQITKMSDFMLYKHENIDFVS